MGGRAMRPIAKRRGVASITAIALLLGSSAGLLLAGDGSTAAGGGNLATTVAVGWGHGSATLPSTLLVSGPPSGASGPDDLTYLPPRDDHSGNGTLWTQYQNGVGPDGSPSPSGATRSTIAGYDVGSGALLTTITVPGHVDGLTADPSAGELLATSNEDANSAFYVIHPWAGSIVRFNYTPSPQAGANGGTDSIALWQGGMYVSHSNPNDTTQATVFELQLDWYGHAARLHPVFWDDSVARFEPAGTSGHLALTDPDSNYVMPSSSPGFAGDLATISQGDGRLIFAGPHGHRAPGLVQLNLTDNVSGNLPPIDGIAEATADAGTLYVVDAKAETITALSTNGWSQGTLFVGEPRDNGNPLVGTLSLSTGKISPLANPFESPKGMVFLPAPGTGPGHDHGHHHGDDGEGGGHSGWGSGWGARWAGVTAPLVAERSTLG